MLYKEFTLLLLVVSSSCGSKTLGPYQADVQNPSPSSRIVGGETVNITDYPYMAGYHWTSKEGHSGFCNGAIITNEFVVTVAHCIDEITDPSVLTLRVGNTNRTKGTIIPVLEIIQHPDYLQDSNDLGHNVALLKTKQIPYSMTVQPVQLPAEEARIPTYVTVTGWGLTAAGGNRPELLRGIELKTTRHLLCTLYTIEEQAFCAGGNMQGVCAGDDGAPAVQKDENSPKDSVLFGLTVFQPGCGAFIAPVLFLNVADPDILEFITETINGDNKSSDTRVNRITL